MNVGPQYNGIGKGVSLSTILYSIEVLSHAFLSFYLFFCTEIGGISIIGLKWV